MKTILVVDDMPNIRRLIRINLERQGYHVEEAETGKEALNCLRQGGIDFVFVDHMLPDMKGEELLAILRQDPALADIPAELASPQALRRLQHRR